jgi:hypothetical protein
MTGEAAERARVVAALEEGRLIARAQAALRAMLRLER